MMRKSVRDCNSLRQWAPSIVFGSVLEFRRLAKSSLRGAVSCFCFAEAGRPPLPGETPPSRPPGGIGCRLFHVSVTTYFCVLPVSAPFSFMHILVLCFPSRVQTLPQAPAGLCPYFRVFPRPVGFIPPETFDEMSWLCLLWLG